MTEWPIVPVLKTGKRDERFVGSNPTSSATKRRKKMIFDYVVEKIECRRAIHNKIIDGNITNNVTDGYIPKNVTYIPQTDEEKEFVSKYNEYIGFWIELLQKVFIAVSEEELKETINMFQPMMLYKDLTEDKFVSYYEDIRRFLDMAIK